MEELRLEHLAFVGYQRPTGGQSGEAAAVSTSVPLVHFVAPQGSHVFFHPSLPTPTTLQQQQQSSAATRGPPQQKPGNDSAPPLPPPSQPHPTASGSREGHKATQHEQQLPPPSVEADGLLNVLTAASAPPADFQVEFVLSSSSSSSDSSTSSSRSASAAQDHLTAEDVKSDAAAPREEDVKTDEAVGDAPALVEVATEENVKEEPVADDGAALAAAAVALPASYEHGIELVVQPEHQAQLDTLLTQSALKLFNGRLPQPPPPPPATAEGNSTEASSPVTWSEAPHYHRVVLMGYDAAAGAACLMAVPFAQPLAPPPSTSAATWRLCPLPVLLCPVVQLTHFFDEEKRVTEDKSDARPATAPAAGDESGVRYPALPRAVMSGSATAAKSAHGSLATSPMPSPTNSPPRGGALLPPPPPPPTSSSRPPPPPPPTSAGTSSSTSPPLGTPANAAGGHSAYSCPPLRWHFTSIGQLPSLDLAELFHVMPNTVYQLRSPAEEVVFMGVACGVPWVREVTRSVVAGGAGGGGGRGLTLQTGHATSASSGGAAAAAAAPAGYRWKDLRGLVVPLVCCHDARDLRGRHGLVDHAEKKAEEAPASAATAQTHENEVGKEEEEAEGHPQEEQQQQQQSEKGEDKGHERQQSSPPPPPSLRTPAAATASTAAPRFVKEGDVVFVPGRFGVMLECVAKPAVLERLFGVVHGDRLLPRTSSEAGDSTAPAATALVTVMGVYNRNGLVVLADGASHATQITIHRGAEEVAELFEKVQKKNDADTAATGGNEGGSFAPSSPPPAREEEKEEAVVAVEESPESVTQRAGRTSIFVEESTTPLRDDVACSASGAALTTPDAAEGDPDKVSPFLRHSAEEEAGEGEEEEGGSMASAPPANAQAAPMFASTQRTPTPATSTQSSYAPSVGEAGATGVASDPVAEDAAEASHEDECVLEMGSIGAGGAVAHTRVGVDEVEGNDEDGAVPHAPSTGNTAAPVVDSDDESTPPPPTALLLSHAEDVTVTSAGQSPTTAAPPTADDGDREGAVEVEDAQLREGDVVVVAVAAEESEDERSEAHYDDEEVHMTAKQDESEVMLNDRTPPALPTHHVQDSHTASPVLHTADDATASMSRVHGEDTQECSTSAAVLSSDHTPSILPTPSASLSRQLQSERRPDDNEGGAPHRHHEPQQHHMERANDDGIERHVINGDAAAAAAAPPVPHLPLPSHPLCAKHLLATQQHSDEMEKLNTAATVITPFEASAARSSESPSAVMPEAYYTDITTPNAAAQAGTVQHPQQGTHVGGPLYQEVFTPSYSPPAGPADGHTAPRVGGGGGSGGHARHPNGQAASPSSREAPRPLSMMTAASTATSAAPTPTPFTNFMKAFAIYSLRASTTEQLASTPALPGMPPILDFYRAQALKRVAAATAAHRRCRAAWSGVGVVAVQQLRQTATTTLFEDLCVDELVALLAVLCETSAT